MADNVTVYSTALYVVASDDDGTAQHQYVKLEFGADNTQTKVSASNPLPITGTALWGTVAVGASLPAGSAFLGTVANAGTIAVSSLPAGTSTLGTVALVGALPAGSAFLGTVAGAGTVAVSSVVAQLPAGVNTIGTVARVGATPAGTNTIGTVALVGALPAGTSWLGTVSIAPALPAGSAFLGTVANAGTVAVSSIVASLPAGVNTLGTVALAGSLSTSGTVAVSSIAAGVNTIGTVAPVGTFTTKETRSSTGTMSHVGASSSVVGLLNTNANRLGFSIQNDATGNLYIGYGSNVSTTDYVARMTQYAYFEVPFNYTGTVCGLWSTVVASDGGARITEYS